jgi:hypothetical protein
MYPVIVLVLRALQGGTKSGEKTKNKEPNPRANASYESSLESRRQWTNIRFRRFFMRMSKLKINNKYVDSNAFLSPELSNLNSN